MKTFSVIVPVYNAGLYLEKCIKSVLEQNERNLELILVDDGSTDGSEMICDLWLEKDDRVIVFHQKNAGAAAARNQGIEIAQGNYFIFLDSDDWWNDKYVLSNIKTRLENVKPDVLVTNFEKGIDEKVGMKYFNHESFKIKYDGYSFEDISKYDLWVSSSCNKVINSKLFDNGALRFREGITAEDLDWCVRLALSADKYDYLSDSLFVYRQHDDSTSNNISIEKKECQWDNILECLRLSDESPELEKRKSLNRYLSYQYAVFIFSLAKCPNSEKKNKLIRNAKNYSYLLKFSNNKKVRIIYYFNKLFGFFFTIFLLRLL